MNESSNMGRRAALRLIAVLPIALLGARPLLARAQAVDELKRQYRYRKHPFRHRRCMQCVNYTGPARGAGTCRVLQTTVTWEGWCTQWQSKVS